MALHYRLSILLFVLLLFAHRHSFAQLHGSISGTVRTSDGNPASFVTVGLTGTHKGTITADDGSYHLKNIAPGSYTLRITFVGLKPQEKAVTVAANKHTEASITLLENTSQLDEVEVTGIRKTPTVGKASIAPLDLPQMTGIVSRAVIENQQVSRLGDALRNISGVSLTQQRGGVSETFSARGYSIGVSGAAGSLFKNGVITNSAGFPEASTLESIEVLKGSSAMLYGNVSGGLIINMVTKKPKFNFGGEVSMRYGSYNLYKPIVDLYGPLSKNLAFRIVGTYENADSFRDVVNTKRVYVNPSLLYKLGPKTTLLLEGDYLKSNLTPDNGIGSLNQNQDAVIPTSIPRSRFINTNWAYSHLEQATGTLTVNHAFTNNWRLTAIGSAQGTTVSSFGAAIPNNTIQANGDWIRTLSRAKTAENDYTGQVNLNGRFSTGSVGHQVLVGADLVGIVSSTNTFTITSNGKTVANYDTVNVLNPAKYTARTDIPNATALVRTTAPSVRMGVYVQDLVTLTDKLKVLLGIRWSQQKTAQTTLFDWQKQTETRGTTDTKVDQAFSPKVALIYQPVKTTSIFGSYANNFTINTGVDLYGQILKPSIVDQVEVGVKNEFFDGRFTANASIYRIINSNLAQMAPFKGDGSPNTDSNVKEFTGQTTSDGVEIDLTGNLSKNLFFMAGYGYNYMRYTNTSLVKGSYIAGERLINNPAHTASATLFYTFDLPQLRGLKFGASVFYTGARYGGTNNQYGQTPEFSRLIPLTGFTTIDLSAGYTYRKISLLAKVSNITNALNYLIHDRYSIMPIPPRQFVTTVSYKF